MKLSEEALLLRVFIGEKDKCGGKPLYEEIVLKANEAGLAGATVLRGIMGFGATTRKIKTAKILDISDNLPLVVEIVDTEEKIRQFIPSVECLMTGGLVTLEKAKVIHYSPEKE